jgi:hypothetical protein
MHIAAHAVLGSVETCQFYTGSLGEDVDRRA